MSTICDVHCHFFSSRFLEILVANDRKRLPADQHAAVIAGLLGWEPPSTPEQLADRWVRELAPGATGWLVKPFDPTQLLATISKVLG